MTKLVPYDPSPRDNPGSKSGKSSEQVHYHYYDQRTIVQDGADSDTGSDEEEPGRSILAPWQKYAIGLIAALLAMAAIAHFTSPATQEGSADGFASAAPVPCLGHWSYAPSLEQAMDVYVTKAGDLDYNVIVTKVAAGDAANEFQNVSSVHMMRDDTSINGVVTKAILHDASKENTLDCRTEGARFNYRGQSTLLKHVNADLRSIVAANGWQWPQALDPNKAVASACEGKWLLDHPDGTIAVDVARKDNFYEVSLLTQRNADSTRKFMATSGDATHLVVDWAARHFSMTCSPEGAGAELGDGSPAIIMTRLSAPAYRRLLAQWWALNAANAEDQLEDGASNDSE